MDLEDARELLRDWLPGAWPVVGEIAPGLIGVSARATWREIKRAIRIVQRDLPVGLRLEVARCEL